MKRTNKMNELEAKINSKAKLLNETRNKINFVNETNWMFENNEGVNPIEQLP